MFLGVVGLRRFCEDVFLEVSIVWRFVVGGGIWLIFYSIEGF